MSETMCSPSLQWSPSPAAAQCKPGMAHCITADVFLEPSEHLPLFSEPTAAAPVSVLKCKLWETARENSCVCLMPFQCA